MAARDVTLKFGADVSGVGTAMLQASRSVNEFAGNVRSSVENANSAFQQIGSIVSDAAKVAAGIVAANAAVKVFALSDAGLAASTALSASAMGRAAISAGTYASSLLSAASGAVVTTVAANALGYALVAAPLVGAAAFAYLEAKAWETAPSIAQVGRQMAFAGNVTAIEAAANGFVFTGKVIGDYINELQKIPGVTQGDATAIQGLFGSIHNYSSTVNDALVDLLAKYAGSSDQAKAAAKEWAAVFDDPNARGQAFLQSLAGVTNAEVEQFRAAQQTGNVNRMNAAIYDVIVNRFQALGQEATRATAEQLQNAQAFGTSQKFVDSLTESLRQQNEALASNVAALRARGAAVSAQPLTLEQSARAINSVLQSDNPLTAQLDAVNARIATLRSGLQGSTTDAGKLVAGFESFSANAKVDSDGRFRAGFGSDTTTSASGQVSPVTSSTVVTMEDAWRDLNRRIPEFTAEAAKEIGAQFNNLSAAAKASIASVAYNYGHVPDSVIAAARTGSDQNVASAIGGLTSNPMRRQQEAANITNAPGGVGNQAAITADMRAQLDLRQQLLDKQAGGNALDQANLAIAARNAAGARNDVADQEQRNAALERQLALTNDLSARSALQLQLEQGRAALADRQLAVVKAQDQLAITRADTPAAKRDAQVAAGQHVQAAFPDRSSEQFIAAQNQIEQANKTFQAAQAADDAAVEEAKYQTALNGFNERITLIKSETQEREIAAQEGLARQVAVNAQIEALQIAHQKRLQEIYGEGTPQFRAAATQIQTIPSATADANAKAQAEAAKQVQASWKSAFDAIGSNVTTSLEGMIQRTTTFGQAAKSLATSIEDTFLQAGVKIVENWALQMAKMALPSIFGAPAQGTTGAAGAGGGAVAGAASPGGAAASGVQ